MVSMVIQENAIADLPALVTVAEAATALRVSGPSIRRMVARGDIQAVRVGAQVRILRAALDELLTPTTPERSR
jgi:excisionase family DNA binding protein